MNALNQITIMRDFLGEASAAHWTDRSLLACLNMAQRRLALKVSKSIGGWLITSASVTPSSSIITLPVDCSKPVYLEETTSGIPIPFHADVFDRRLTRQPSTAFSVGVLEAYPLIGTLEVNKASYSTACTLWYQIRVPDLHVGTAAAGGATSLTMSVYDGVGATSGIGSAKITSYYVNSSLEVMGGTGAGGPVLISAYTSARVATLASGTYGNDSTYGTISRLPEECHLLMTLEGVLNAIAKPSSALDPKYFEYFRTQWKDLNDEFLTWVADWRASRKGVRITEVE